jgi:hypothetical protein
MAGITHLQEFQEPALRGLVDETVATSAPSQVDTFLPTSTTYSTTFAYDIVKQNQHIAAMIGYGAEPPVVDRDAVASKMGEIAKFGLKYIATEEELLALHQARSNSEKSAMVDKLTVKSASLVEAIQRRIEVIKAEALFKGTFSYNKNGVKVSLDYGVPAEHKQVLPTDDDWDNKEHDAIADLLNFVSIYEKNNGQSPEVILMSREAQAKLLVNSQIIVEAGRPTGSTRVSQAELNAVLDNYGIPAIQIVKDRKVTVKDIYTGLDEDIEFFPVNRIVMLSKGVGNFLLGPTVESNFEPRIALTAYDKNEPIESIIRTVASGAPAVNKPSLIFHADVFTA